MLHQPIFSDKYLKTKLSNYDLIGINNIQEKQKKIIEWQTAIKKGNIKITKERALQTDFLNTFFGETLEYAYNRSEDKWNLEKEFKSVVDGTQADGALGYFSIAGKDARVVIELKDIKNDLDKPQSRIDKRTPIEQAFSYANKAGGKCKWVIVSNFREIRLYNASDQSKYELFDILELLNGENLKKFFFLLHKDRLLLETQKSSVDILFEERQAQEQKISKEFYSDYKNVRAELFNHLKQNNSSIPEVLLFTKAQKILDRIIFICFCEDLNLLPEYTFRNILKNSKNIIDFSDSKLWTQVKNLFKAIDKGYPDANINKFNGGLFAEDKDLDNLIIKDSVIEHIVHLAEYDFDSDLNVNILGHIFEQSISDIEEIKAHIEGNEFDNKKGKRKKDGIFYTPEYITRYIVKEAVAGWLEDRKIELGIDKLVDLSDKDYDSIKIIKVRDKATKKNTDKLDYNKNIEKHILFWESYRKKLSNIKVLDPACGSGAFLNQVFDYLHREGESVNSELAKLRKGQREAFDLDKHILTNNIFGVDLNPESVEITKLSLWLKTANRYKELTALDNNIQCGNSLIDNTSIGGKIAFKWEERFEKIMNNGGFDVIIGNPPYVGEKGHSVIFETLKKIPKWKDYYRRRSNTYYFFIKQGIDLLKQGGIQSLIVPREFTTADWANKVRKEILDKTRIIELVDFNDLKVFDDAGTTSLVITHSKVDKQSKYTFNLKSIRSQKDISTDLFENTNDRIVNINELDGSGEKIWSFYQNAISLDKSIVPLITLFDISQGLVTGADKIGNKHLIAGLAEKKTMGRGIFMLKEGIDIDSSSNLIKLKIGNDWVTLNEEDKTFIKQYIKTEGLNKWQVTTSDLKVIYIGDRILTQKIQEYLMQFSSVLINRSTTVQDGVVITLKEFEKFTLNDIKEKYSLAGAVQKIMKRKKWYLPLYERTNVPFSSSKIIVNTKNMDKFTYSDNEHYSSGGGAGGQNYIYPVLEKDKVFFNELMKESDLASFVKFTNAILNSEKIQTFISSGQFNQLSTEKIGVLPIIKPSFKKEKEKKIYESIVAKANFLISSYESLNKISTDFVKLLKSSFAISENDLFKNWHTLGFRDFIKQLNQKIKNGGEPVLNKTSELEWMEVFENQKAKISIHESEIYKVEKEIDQMVYRLYD